MKDNDKTKKQQITALGQLRRRIAELERSNSKLKGAVEEFRESREDLEAIFNDVRDGIVQLNLTGKIIKINKRIIETTGYTDKDIVGKRFKFLTMFTADSIKRMITAFAKTVAGHPPPPYEVEAYIKTGEKRIAEIHSSQLKKRRKTVGAVAVIRDVTERKRAEEALRESEEKYGELINGMNDTAWVIDFNGNFIDVNNAAVEILGYSRKKLLSMGPQDIDTKMDAKEIKGLIKRMAKDKLQVFETIHTTKDGKTIPVEIKSTLVTYKGQQAILSIARDITDRKRAEEALRESAEKYHIITSTAMDGFAVADVDGHILDVNEESCHMLGYSRDEQLTMSIQDIEAVETTEEIKRHFQKVIETGSDRFESRLRRKDGRLIEAEISLTFMPQSKLFLIFHRDITDRKQAEKRIRESEERYRALYEDNPSMYFTVDPEGTVLSVNQFGADQLGYTAKELLGQAVMNVFHEDDQEAVKQQLTVCIQHPSKVFHQEFRKVRKDGNILWVKETARAVRCAEDNPVVLIVCEDISARKLMEEALRQSEANLKKAQEVGHIGSWHLDLKKNELIWSDEACRIFEVPQETVLTYEEFLEVVHPDDREYVDEAWTAALDKELYDIEHRIVVNGEVKWVRERAEVERDDKAKGIRATGTVQDITDLKRAEEELQESFERLKGSLESTVSALASALEMRDPYTAGHQQRVTDLACAIAEEMGLTEEQTDGIRLAGLIHDIGKISIPAEILNKPGQLTEIEYSLFKNHPQVGHDVLKNVEFPWPVAEIVLQHHERMDGSGYPQGLSGEEIMLEAMILAVADIVEAIASHRPYRPARGAGDALEEILRNKGTLYDPEVVDACLRVFYEKGFTFERFLRVAQSGKIH